MMNKITAFAQMIDVMKLTRRATLISYAYLTWTVSQWFMSVPDPSTAQTAFASAVIGMCPAMLAFYVNKQTDYSKFVKKEQKQRDLEMEFETPPDDWEY